MYSCNELGYKFCLENKKYLLEFLKIAQEQKTTKLCDLSQHISLNKLYPLNEQLKIEVKDYIEKQNVIIDITDGEGPSDDTNEKINDVCVEENLSRPLNFRDINKSAIEDLTYSIKEQLETQKSLSSTILWSLHESHINKNVFSLLSEQLTIENVINIGVSIQYTNISEDIISNYIELLLIKKLTLEYSDQLQDILNQFSINYSNILLDELIKVLPSKSQDKLFMQYADGLNMDIKTKLFRKFVFDCENFHEDYLNIAETLITTQVEYNTLNKLIEIFSNSINNFTNDKSFGKLLVKVIQLLGKNVASLEQPLKHIIACHKSIWKSKIQKVFDDYLQESSLLSQSYR